MSRIEVPMPQMGESIAEGTVSVWLKEIGERVERDEPIMEISTDKVDAEIPSPAEGTLVEILVRAGETVEVGTVVAFIETEAGAAQDALAAVASAPASAASAATERETEEVAEAGQPAESGGAGDQADGGTQSPGTDGGPATSTEPALAANAKAAPSVGQEESLEERLRTRSSPLVRRMAEEHGIDLRRIDGSGRLGRVTKDDILAYLSNGGTEGDARQRAQRTTGSLAWEDFYTRVEHPTVAVGPADRVEPMSRMTQLIADHMVLSQRVSPHVHSFIEVDYSRIDRVRAGQRELWAEQGAKVSYTAFIARAVATALREHPKLNASVSGTDVVYRSDVNIGVAVALPWGLIVPVVKRADELSLVGLALRITDLADRARAKKLSPEEVQGGTFTITNPGVFGTVIGFPIINQPQVAILCVGGIEKRPVVITDEFGNDAIVPRKRGFIALGFDHRLVNGADGDSFLARVKELMESANEG
jgi:pyruvate dehydrogenase E2 component (dihydrolipoamide acetyltransferase)